MAIVAEKKHCEKMQVLVEIPNAGEILPIVMAAVGGFVGYKSMGKGNRE